VVCQNQSLLFEIATRLGSLDASRGPGQALAENRLAVRQPEGLVEQSASRIVIAVASQAVEKRFRGDQIGSAVTIAHDLGAVGSADGEQPVETVEGLAHGEARGILDAEGIAYAIVIEAQIAAGVALMKDPRHRVESQVSGNVSRLRVGHAAHAV